MKTDRSAFLFLTLLALPILILVGAPHVYALGHYGIPGTLDGCDVCHDFAGGYYDSPTLGNLRWVNSSIEWPLGTVHSPVKFTIFSSTLPADGTMGDGDDLTLDGPCEVCHTTADYHTNTGDGTNHFDGQNCTACHPHFANDIINYFEPRFIGTQSHITHWTDPKGPQLGEDTCTVCHYASDFSRFADGELLADTAICDGCHSRYGAYNGVDDTTVGAKANWEEGIYEANGSDLKPGKDDWCATCHDNGTSTVNGVDAPNVMGDNTTYGYNLSGHGEYALLCKDCHSYTVLHTDGDARTYAAASNNYRDGYRLNEDMAVPRNGEIHPQAFRLCTNCHTYTDITGPTSNFRDDGKGLQFHEMHLNWWPAFICADSDFDGVGCSSGICKDSAMTCINCHNVHGSPTAPMIRHGELMSTPGTSDKVPALDFRWYKADGTTQTTVLEESLYGGLICGLMPDVSVNHVCSGCHTTAQLKWYRTPGGPLGVTVEAVWTSTLADVTKTVFAPNEDIRYHARFKIVGSGSYFVKAADSKAKSTSGIFWKTELDPKKLTLSEGTYEWTWDEAIPGTATPGSGAKLVVLMKMFDAPGGTLLSKEKKTATFSIAP
ncbi:MAG: hypothetical protein SWH78_02670 [Thermodesulfobacteriota bacterium]|nr:hypothetical protein [Thermodesulfobacteriota bacterium]